MKQTDIEAFLAIIEYNSISAAAQSLYIGQPTLSARIQALEKELGVTLFHRGRGLKNTDLTPEGKRFEPYARKWQKLWEETQYAVSNDSNDNLIVISGHSISACIIPYIYRHLQKIGCGNTFTFSSYHYQEIFRMVENGEADFGFVSNLIYTRTLRVIPLFTEEMVVLHPLDSNLPELIHPSTLEVSNELHVFWNNDYDKWHSYWIGPQSAASVRTSDITLVGQCLQIENKWSIVPISVAITQCRERRLRYSHLSDPPEPRLTCLVIRPNQKEIPVLPEIISEMHRVVTELGGEWLLSEDRLPDN